MHARSCDTHTSVSTRTSAGTPGGGSRCLTAATWEPTGFPHQSPRVGRTDEGTSLGRGIVSERAEAGKFVGLGCQGDLAEKCGVKRGKLQFIRIVWVGGERRGGLQE